MLNACGAMHSWKRFAFFQNKDIFYMANVVEFVKSQIIDQKCHFTC